VLEWVLGVRSSSGFALRPKARREEGAVIAWIVQLVLDQCEPTNHEPKEIVLAEELVEDLFRIVFRVRRLLVGWFFH
jgi:hypothetical protein